MTTPNRCPQCQTPLPPDAPLGLCPACLLRVGLPSEPVTNGPGRSAAATSDYSPRFQAPAPAELQPHFPDLEIQHLLGQGGMGAVYRARQLKLDRWVALKILPKNAAPEAAFADRFSREARAMARLSHPHIVGIHDFGEAGTWFYFVMEFVDGVDLRQALRARTIEPRQALNIVSQICDALQYAHDEGIVHRDIKPENILLDQRGRAKIADFGLAKLLGQTSIDLGLTGTNQVMGTVGYMAPEQLEGAKAVDHRADIYALGVVFYELLTGELPMGRFDPPSHKVRIDVRLDEVVLKTLEKEPARRYQQASAVKEEIERVSQAPTATAPRQPSSANFNLLTLPAIGLVAVGVLELLLLFVAIADAHEKRAFKEPQLWLILVMGGLMLGIAPLIGGLLMLLRKGYELAVLGAILTLLPLVPLGFLIRPTGTSGVERELAKLPTPLFEQPTIVIVPLLGITLAVWALVLLVQPAVRQKFTWSVWSAIKWLWGHGVLPGLVGVPILLFCAFVAVAAHWAAAPHRPAMDEKVAKLPAASLEARRELFEKQVARLQEQLNDRNSPYSVRRIEVHHSWQGLSALAILLGATLTLLVFGWRRPVPAWLGFVVLASGALLILLIAWFGLSIEQDARLAVLQRLWKEVSGEAPLEATPRLDNFHVNLYDGSLAAFSGGICLLIIGAWYCGTWLLGSRSSKSEPLAA